jgi:hypothetical protein
MDFRRPAAPGRTRMVLGGEVLYEPGHPLSDLELDRRIKRALESVGWKKPAPAPTVPPENERGVSRSANPSWALLVSNQRPPPCEGGALPLS